MRRSRICTRKSVRTNSKTSTTTRATPLRMAKISNIVRPPRDNSRIDTAMTETDSSAPTIQRMTRTRFGIATFNFAGG